MGKMAYCSFQKTLEDLRDCEEYLDEELSSEEEEKARKLLIKLCGLIAEDFGEN